MEKQQILAFFESLNEKLRGKGVLGEIGVVGGTAMVLGFDARASTKDIDAIFVPAIEIREAAAEVAESMSLSSDVLNDAVKGFIYTAPEKCVLLEYDCLRIWMPPPEYLFAMKCCSARYDSSDHDDIMFFIDYLGLTSLDEGLRIIEEYVPKKRIPAKTSFFLEEIFEKGVDMEF